MVWHKEVLSPGLLDSRDIARFSRELSSMAGSHSIADGTRLVTKAEVEDAQRTDAPAPTFCKYVQSRIANKSHE